MPDEIDDQSTPPDVPPGEPSLETNDSNVDRPAQAAKEKTGVTATAPVSQPTPPPASFTSEQIRDLGAAFAAGLTNNLKPQTQDTPAPTASLPSGPTPAELQAQIDQIEQQIDLAVEESKPIRELQRQRDQIRDRKFELEHVAPLRIQGANSINSLVLANLRRDDPYFRKYEREVMGLLGPIIQSGQALTEESAREAMNLVRGRHQDEIFNDMRNEQTRKEKLEQTAPTPGAITGRRQTVQPRTPDTIRERFGVNAEEAMSSKRAKGYNEDLFARRLGFRDKADWFAKDDAMSSPEFNIGLDSVWDKRNNRWVNPDELNEFYGG